MVTLGNPPDPQVVKKQKKLRKGESYELDAEIQTMFALDFKKIAEGENDTWFDDTDGVLAIIIMYQLFSKFMFRGDKRAYQFEPDAITLSRYIVEEVEYQ